MHLSILRSGILLALLLGVSVATAQTELFFATGVDSTGWAQAQSNADGHVLIESPQYPRGLWLHLVDEAGDGAGRHSSRIPRPARQLGGDSLRRSDQQRAGDASLDSARG